ncbi:efflux RND transporter periplasmic adaptor subunit [Pseudomonadota bacterium]
MSENKRRLLFIPAIAVGIIIFMLMSGGKQGAPREVQGERAVPVRFITAEMQDVVPVAVGNGSVSPTRVWSAISQVQGRVVELPSQFRAGMVIQKDQLLLRVDDTDYQLAIAQAQATIQATEAQLKQLASKADNLNMSLNIEQEVFNSAQKEWQRLKKLSKQGTVSTSQLEAQERSYLAQKLQLQNIKNSLVLLPSDRSVLQAQLAQQQAQLKQAELNLQRTTLKAPFNARLAEVNVELGQYIRVGEVLAVLDDMEQAEVEAQFPLDHFTQLVQPIDIKAMMAKGEMPGPHMLKLTSRVQLNRNGAPISWDSTFVRTDAAIDPQTRTVGAVVTVDDPYANAMPPLRPPLVKGMYVSVLLAGPAHKDQIAIPRQALHGDEVYVINSDNRLERRKVELFLRQPGFFTVAAGISAGELVVISDLIPAVDGMLLKPVEDAQATTQLNTTLAAGLGE